MFEAESQLSEGLFKNPGVLNAVVPKIKFPVIIKMIDWKWNVKNKEVLNKWNSVWFNIVTYHSFVDRNLIAIWVIPAID